MHQSEQFSNLDYRDLKRVVELLDEVSNPVDDLAMPERKRKFVAGLAKLVDADVYIWSTTVINHDLPGDFMTTCVIDGGWQSPEEQGRVYAVLTSIEFGRDGLAGVYEMMLAGRQATLGAGEVFPPRHEERLTNIWHKTGFDSLLLCMHPLDHNFSSNLGLHRRLGRPAFGEREKQLVHAVYHGISWLHSYGVNEAVRATTLRLSPRERQTLVFVLAGHSHKSIAERMQISQHTVNDYVKQLHKHFNVVSRAELQANFFLGIPAPGDRE
ncbi:MAG: hypothetical protein C0483_16450 [Pirellula sp.]|nr:hypothetical protein [Pirellula sp.]